MGTKLLMGFVNMPIRAVGFTVRMDSASCLTTGALYANKSFKDIPGARPTPAHMIMICEF